MPFIELLFAACFENITSVNLSNGSAEWQHYFQSFLLRVRLGELECLPQWSVPISCKAGLGIHVYLAFLFYLSFSYSTSVILLSRKPSPWRPRPEYDLSHTVQFTESTPSPGPSFVGRSLPHSVISFFDLLAI